jgi:hypothetical protein
MRYLVCLVVLLLFSCESEIREKEVISVAGKSLKAINHTFYNYLYENQPATRTHTSNMTISDDKIIAINNTVFHYFNDDLSKNYTYTTDYSYAYNSFGLLIDVQTEGFSDLNPTVRVLNSYDFTYNANNEITEINYRNSFGDILTKYIFTYVNDAIHKRVEFYDSFGLVYYNEIELLKDNNGKIYEQSSKGPILSTTNINALSEVLQEATFDTNNNLETLAINGEVYTEFAYRNTKIPDFLKNIKLPFLDAFPHHILMSDFNQITAYNNSNFIHAEIAKNASSFNKEYSYTFSIEDYPLEVEVTANNTTQSKTVYNYN